MNNAERFDGRDVALSILGRAVAFLLLGMSVSGSPQTIAADLASRSRSSIEYQQLVQPIENIVAKSKGASLSVGIIKAGGLVWSKSYGSEGTETIHPASDQTVYGILSVSKIVTGIMFLQLVDKGVVHLTDPVDRYVPEIRQVKSAYPWTPPITLMQLATMTTGLAGHWSFEHPDTNTWEQNLIASIPSLHYDFEPGTQRQYANINYGILGLALSRAAHRPYADYVETAIFRPLGMTNTSFSVSGAQLGTLAFPQSGSPTLSWKTDLLLPAAGVFSTLADMSKLMAFQLGFGPEDVLSHKALENAYRLLVPSDGDLRYGDGVGVSAVRSPDSNLVVLGHGGHGTGYVAAYEFDRSTGSGMIVLTTHVTDDYKPLVRAALKKLSPESIGGTGLPPAEDH